ncbi:MAG TPA: hypothetical protein VEB21_02375 [Terriglobales bacterium]|nr:hypothetical protein [Terriglobales bacterium]
MTDTAVSSFLGCRTCQTLVPVPLAVAGEFQDDAGDVLLSISEFLREHQFHPIAQFRKSGADTLADLPLWDPLATLRFEISDGSEVYVATCIRTSVDEPRSFRFAPGRLPAQEAELELDFGDLRRSLDLEFYPHALRPTKVDDLIEVLTDRIGRLDADSLDIAFDVADDPCCSVAPMPPDTVEAVIAASARIFDPWELDKVSRFLRDNSREDGLLALRIRRRSLR